MSRKWRFNDGGGVVVLMRAADARAAHEAHRWPREKAVRFIASVPNDGAFAARRVLYSVVRELDGFVPDGSVVGTRALKSAVSRWLELGRLVALHYDDLPVMVAPGDAGEGDDDVPEDLIKTWIEIRLIDDDGAPVPGVAYRVELPDGRVRTGTTNNNGIGREENLDPGTCQVSFPDLHGLDWTRA